MANSETYKPPSSDIYIAIAEEVEFQYKKHGHKYDRSPDNWLVVLAEEFGEIALSINEEASEDDLATEITQTAAVCISWLAHIEQQRKIGK